MADLLDDEAIDSALASLPGWRRDGDRLVKEAPVPEPDREVLESSIGAVADEIDHHPVTTHTDDGVRFELWTHSAGGITAKDVDLASRIDSVLAGTRDRGDVGDDDEG